MSLHQTIVFYDMWHTDNDCPIYIDVCLKVSAI